MNVWVEAARPRTLPAAVVPVAVGTASAVAADPGLAVSWDRAGLALVVALALQVAVNYANDLFDGVAGIDTPDRLGPRRAVAAGLVAPAAMRRALTVALAVAAAAGTALAVLVDLRLLLVGAVAMLAALGYSGGRRPYASRGFGEVAVFVFFGLVATGGSAYVQTLTVDPLAVVAAVPVGLLAVALLMVNNVRDVTTDAAAGKRTLAVRLGGRRYGDLYGVLLVVAVALVVPVSLRVGSGWPLLALAALPLLGSTLARSRVAARAEGPAAGPAWIEALEATARLQLVLGLLLATGFALAGR
jgi:1,4-dihydroxy-2-naphthoate octaprenyltransferase